MWLGGCSKLCQTKTCTNKRTSSDVNHLPVGQTVHHGLLHCFPEAESFGCMACTQSECIINSSIHECKDLFFIGMCEYVFMFNLCHLMVTQRPRGMGAASRADRDGHIRDGWRGFCWQQISFQLFSLYVSLMKPPK